MKDDSKARDAMREYVRLVRIIDDEDWTSTDPELLEEVLGRPVIGREAFNRYVAARDAFDEAIVDAIAEALNAGVSQKWLVDHRGYLGLAKRPISYDYRPAWVQASMLAAIRTDVQRVAATDPEEAAHLLRAGKSLLRRWVRQVPLEPSEKELAVVAARWRSEHVRLWREARAQLVEDIDRLALPEDPA